MKEEEGKIRVAEGLRTGMLRREIRIGMYRGVRTGLEGGDIKGGDEVRNVKRVVGVTTGDRGQECEGEVILMGKYVKGG